MSPPRRRFLQTLVTGVTFGLAGCSAPGDVCVGGLSARQVDSDDPPPTVFEPQLGDDDDIQGYEPLASYIIDCQGLGFDRPWYDVPQRMSLWNIAPEPQPIKYSLTSARHGQLLGEEERSFGPRDLVYFRFREPDDYRLQVRRGERQAVAELPRRRFDCNDSHTRVIVPSTGRIEDETISTAVGCPFSDLV